MSDGLIALDLATRTGWAAWAPGRRIASGAITLPDTGKDVGTFLATYWRWLNRVIEEWDPAWLIFESPILPGTTTLPTCRKLYGLAGVTEMAALHAMVGYREVAAPTVRKNFTGHGGGTKKEIKARVTETCRLLGFDPQTHDEADALAILHYSANKMKIDLPSPAGPLFTEERSTCETTPGRAKS